MIRVHQLDKTAAGAISAIPLFYASSGIRQAILLGGSVVLSLLIFEFLFSLVKRFWLRSFRSLFALIILASVLELIFLACSFFLWEQTVREIGSAFSLTLVSAFFLAQDTLTGHKPFVKRLRSWVAFFILLLILGMIRQWSANFPIFSPGPFWIAGSLLAAFYALRQKVNF